MKKHDIGNALKKIRTNRNIQQQDLAPKIGISRSTLARLENNDKDITVRELLMYLNYFDIPISTFFTKLIFLESELENITNNFNIIANHYEKHKNNNLHLIKNEINFFRNYFEELEKDNLVNLGFNIQYYMELPLMYPKYFLPPNVKLLNLQALTILHSDYLFEDDYLFLGTSIPYLSTTTIDFITNTFKETEYNNFSNSSRQYYELLFENLSDYYLVHYKEYDSDHFLSYIQTVFKVWDTYCKVFGSLQNKIVYQHNYTMYEFLTNKRDKEILKIECDKRYNNLVDLRFDTFAEQLKNESDDYYNGVYGNLNIALKY